MTVTLTLDTANAKVTITATGLAAANYATVERSINQVVWTTVRGGVQVALTAGAFTAPLDDYEFTPGVTNYYRVRGVETAAITFVAAGAASTANNASVTPALPAGLVVGDAMIAFVSIRNSGAGTVNTPAGWTLIRAFGNAALFGRRNQAGDAAPTFTFTGGVLNADTIGQIAAWRSADIAPHTSTDQLNGSAQNIATPALTITQPGCVLIAAGWKQDDWTSVATFGGGGWAEIGEPSATAGDDAGQVWDYIIETTPISLGASSFVVTGGASAISRGAAIALPHAPFLNEQTSTIVPVLDRVWLKSLTRPFLNRPVTVVGFTDPSRPARSTEHDVVGRTNPVARNDLRSSRRWTVDLYTKTASDAQTLDFLLASGDVMLLHVPRGADVPGGYVQIKDTGQRHPDGRVRGAARVFTLPLVEVAPPGPDVAATIGTWTSVLAGYADWNAVLAAFPTWADLLALHGDPAEVIVP